MFTMFDLSYHDGLFGGWLDAGMCGTAAVVVKVNSITYGDKTMNFDDFEACMNLRLTYIFFYF